MIQWILSFIFIFSFTSSWGQTTEKENGLAKTKRFWTETNYDFNRLFNEDLSAEICFSSEKEFIGCMMAFNSLLSRHDKPHQLKVQGSDFKIIPLTEKETPKTYEETTENTKKLKENFRAFFRAITRST